VTTHTQPADHQRASSRRGDRLFRGATTAAGIAILLMLAGVGVFLALEGIPAFTASASEVASAIPGSSSVVEYIARLAFGTVLAATLALLIAMPLSIGVALFISHYAPRRLAWPLGYLIDLLAAIPSVVYGLWGIFWLAPRLVPVYEQLEKHLGFLPFFTGPASATGRTILTAGIVLAIMILPISTSLCREVFLQTPRLNEEAALALGATRWEVVRLVVFPHARSGMVSAAMLGLGRALGETMAVALVLSASNVVSLNLISSVNPSTIAANIALKFSDSSGVAVNVLIASGLCLFIITFIVNFIARAIVARKDTAGAPA
jgi:phosphate transport system permease protein